LKDETTEQKSTKFIPSKKQINFLKVYISSEKTTMKDIATEAGVSRTLIYDWRQKPGFVDWFNSEVEKAMHADLPDIWQEVKRRAKRNHNDSKLYLERFDKDYSEKKKIEMESNVNAHEEIKITVVKTEDKEENEDE
jgi:predicted DNA-binding protein YlxM (UPF0122 family)